MSSPVTTVSSAPPATTGHGWPSPLSPRAPAPLVSDALSLQGSGCQAEACGILFASTLLVADRGRPGRPAAAGRGTCHTRPGLLETPHGCEHLCTDAPAWHMLRPCGAEAP